MPSKVMREPSTEVHYKRWCMKEFGSVLSAFEAMDIDSSGDLSQRESRGPAQLPVEALLFLRLLRRIFRIWR